MKEKPLEEESIINKVCFECFKKQISQILTAVEKFFNMV